jgi:chromosome segregation ATPase
MSETELARFEKKFDRFVEYVQGEFTSIRTELREETASLRQDIAASREEISTLRAEMRERFEAVTNRLKRVEDYYANLNFENIRVGREIDKLRSDMEEIRGLILRLESQALETQLRISQLREDMQQRFRIVSERLSIVEKQLAA